MPRHTDLNDAGSLRIYFDIELSKIGNSAIQINLTIRTKVLLFIQIVIGEWNTFAVKNEQFIEIVSTGVHAKFDDN